MERPQVQPQRSVLTRVLHQQRTARSYRARILLAMMRLSLHGSSAASLVHRSMLAARLFMFAGVFATAALPAAAQRPASSRTVDGTVTLKSGGPVNGAVVHLKDTRSLSQKSYITAADGTYHFAQLSGNTDYEIWADSDGKKTPVKSISSFDTKNSFTIALKLSE